LHTNFYTVTLHYFYHSHIITLFTVSYYNANCSLYFTSKYSLYYTHIITNYYTVHLHYYENEADYYTLLNYLLYRNALPVNQPRGA